MRFSKVVTVTEIYIHHPRNIRHADVRAAAQEDGSLNAELTNSGPILFRMVRE